MNNCNRFTSAFFIILFLVVTNSCKKPAVENPAPETGTVSDIENHVYKTIKIGNQWWMAENLEVKTYRNGNPIRISANADDWQDTAAAACLYPDINNNQPGLLYNGYAIADTNNIAPAGWHIPADNEWKELEKQLGMSATEADNVGWRGTHEGEKLKIEGLQGWTQSGDIWATNESGFTALAGSCRLFDGRWGDNGSGFFKTGFWWSATPNAGNQVWYRYLDYKNANIFRSHCSKNYGFSVRCVKD